MTDYGLTSQGFILKRLVDIKADLVANIQNVTDPATGEQLTPDLEDENDPLVLLVNGVSDLLSVCWEQLQICANQFDPNKTTGAAQSGMVQLNGITRKSGTYGTIVVDVTGTPGTVVASGKQVSDMAGNIIFELPTFTLDNAGEATVTGIRTEYDTLTVEANQCVKILTPISGWDTVTNPLISVAGTVEESDTILRARRNLSTAFPSAALVDSMRSGLLNIDGVTFADAYINSGLSTDSRNIPAKTYGIVVQGGDDDEIAEVIYNRSSMYNYEGTTTVQISGDNGVIYDIKFSRPAGIDIYVAITVKVINTNLWPSDGSDQIKAAILIYAQSGIAGLNTTTDAYDQDGYTPGQSVYASDLYIPVLSIPGIKINSLYVDIHGTPTEDTVDITWNEIASFSANNITISVV